MKVEPREDDKRKTCSQCGRYLDILYPKDLCPICEEMNLFSEVKEYIRSNDVKEMDVVDHFGIPLRKVREWIREGRIQYKGFDEKTIAPLHCKICGKPIEFGTICSECLHGQKLQVTAKQSLEVKSEEMRFLHNS